MASYEEYLEYLKETVSTLERLGDKFSGADERLDYAVKQILALQIKPETIAVLERLTGLIEDLKEAGFVMPIQTQQINFHETVQPLTGVRLEEYIPLDGIISSVSLHFPGGCNALVDVAVGHSSKQFLPIGGFIALNDATPVYPTSEKVSRQETVWCVINNTDALQHTVSIAVTIEGE